MRAAQCSNQASVYQRWPGTRGTGHGTREISARIALAREVEGVATRVQEAPDARG